MKREKDGDPGPAGPPAEGVVRRWSRLKRQASTEAEPPAAEVAPAAREEPVPITDADLPPLESLGADSDYRDFLSPGVSEALRLAALRKLFQSAKFNVVDGLDDYAEDYSEFAALGEKVTAEMRHRLEVQARRALERAGVGERTAAEERRAGAPEAGARTGAGDQPEETQG